MDFLTLLDIKPIKISIGEKINVTIISGSAQIPYYSLLLS